MTTAWQRSEDAVRSYLMELYGQKFEKRNVPLRQKLNLDNGEIVEKYEFDAVSTEGRVIAEVKDYRNPHYPQEMKNTEWDMKRLDMANADTKLMFFVDPLFYQVFCHKNGKNLIQWRKKGVAIIPPYELINFLRFGSDV